MSSSPNCELPVSAQLCLMRAMTRIWLGIVFVVLFCGAAGSNELAADRRLHMLDAPYMQGPALSPAQLSGRVVVVTFFASWCPPCIHEFAVLKKIRSEYESSDVTLVAVNVHEAFGNDAGGFRLKRFLKRADPGISVVKGDKRLRDLFGGVARIPTMFVLDAQEREVFRFIHEKDATVRSVDHATLSGVLAATGIAAR